MNKKYKHLSFEERFVIEIMIRNNVLIREIGRFLNRSPNTISREIFRNSTKGEYMASKAKHKSQVARWKAKSQSMKVAIDPFLSMFVEDKLKIKWSPKQISGYLKRNYDIICSSKAIYKFAEKRGLDYLFFWRWNKRKGGRKKERICIVKDGRKYIDSMVLKDEIGHFEIDFIVSKTSKWIFMIIVDKKTKRTSILKLPNRKRSTIKRALSEYFSNIKVKSITTDNDIAFTCWRELEILLNTQIYFTHPYHSWEKGLVENTNRWIRCFVPKRRDIESVTEEEIEEILSFLNDRPRECIGFLTPTEYYLLESSVLLER